MGSSQSHSRTPSRERLPNPPDHQVMDVFDSTSTPQKRGRKRKAGKETDVEMKKVAKLNTCAYVYEKLFIQGEESDITIVACGREWKVHKLYLKQTKFFESMFDGEWSESKSGRVKMEITDPNIDADGLNAVLGSLYHNEIEIDLDNIEATIAAASYIVLDSVTERCAEMMSEALTTNNAVRFYEISTKYGLEGVRELSMNLLQRSFWKIMTDKEKLREVDESLLITLLTSPELLIIEGEFDLYKVVKLWIYMKECPDCDIYEPHDVFSKQMSKYFRKAEKDSIFLKYMNILSCLRMEHFLTCSETVKAITADCLIPIKIINSMTSSLWISLLQSEETPRALEISDEDFFKRCFRLGRTLDTYPKCWRWIGYNFGVDLLLNVSESSVQIKRNCLNQKAPYSVNLKSKHSLHYRLIICDSTSKVIHDSEKTTWEMRPDEARTVYRFVDDLSFPISVHLQYLIKEPINHSSVHIEEYIREIEEN